MTTPRPQDEPEGLIEGFQRHRLPGDGVEVDALVGGSGPPLLLLHGYPQTRLVWRAVAPVLREHFTLVIPDLRGYGRSDKPADDPEHLTYSKRQMARDQIATMAALGFDSFNIAGHDRGARVAYRLALDHPAAVKRLALIDILPTADVFESPGAVMGMFHWSFLAQPYPLPETLLAASPDTFINYLLGNWSGKSFHFDADVLEEYLHCFRDPATRHAGCADYRAAWAVDRRHDLADRGQRKIAAPTLVLWGERGAAHAAQPLTVWRRWAHDVSGEALPAGHFVPEEAAAQTAAALLAFMRQAAG